MKINSLRRWCHRKVILVISTLTESPAHTFQVVSGMRTTGARLFLVQLPAMALNLCPSGRYVPFLLAVAPKSFKLQSAHRSSQTLLWAEILSEVTVLKNTPVERIPALADSLAADLVVLTAPEIGRIPFCAGETGAVDLFGSLAAPILVCGPRAKRRLSSAASSHGKLNVDSGIRAVNIDRLAHSYLLWTVRNHCTLRSHPRCGVCAGGEEAQWIINPSFLRLMWKSQSCNRHGRCC